MRKGFAALAMRLAIAIYSASANKHLDCGRMNWRATSPLGLNGSAHNGQARESI